VTGVRHAAILAGVLRWGNYVEAVKLLARRSLFADFAVNIVDSKKANLPLSPCFEGQ
jgi:hypothetical protein